MKQQIETPERRVLAPIFGVSRLRMATDGDGVTTLVTFVGCPLRCKWCLNNQCHQHIKDIPSAKLYSPRSLMKRAGFPQLKYLGDLLVDELPEDARTALPLLRSLDFVREGRNVVLYGNPGTGKTHLATALGIEACAHGMTVMFTSEPRLITQIREARQERTLRLLENRFINYDLVICDEFGYVSCDKNAGELLFNHLSLRAGKKSVIITTNLAFNRWGEIIADKVLVAAMVDLLTHKAMLINMTGESFRMKETKKLLKN